MNPIPMPRVNTDHPDRVLAQTIASTVGWTQDQSGAIYDQHNAVIARSLDELAVPMRDLGWFTDEGATATGVRWRSLPKQEGRPDANAIARQVSSMMRKLEIVARPL